MEGGQKGGGKKVLSTGSAAPPPLPWASNWSSWKVVWEMGGGDTSIRILLREGLREACL